MTQHDEAGRQSYYLARLEIDREREWFSLHWTSEDAERQLKAAGERNWTLYVAALKCGTYVAGAGLDEQKVRDALEDAADKCGLADDGPQAVSATIASGFRYGRNQPQAVPDGSPAIDRLLGEDEMTTTANCTTTATAYGDQRRHD